MFYDLQDYVPINLDIMMYTEGEKSYQRKEITLIFSLFFSFIFFFFFLVIEFEEDKEMLIKYIAKYSQITHQ